MNYYRMVEGQWAEPEDHLAEPTIKSLYLELYFKDQRLASGTGFTAPSPTGYVLVTARHNVTGRHQQSGIAISSNGGTPDRVKIFFMGKTAEERVPKIERLLDDQGMPLWIEHPKWGAEADFVALRLTDIEGITIHSYHMFMPEPDLEIVAGEVVSVVGYPFGNLENEHCPIWATGFVATDLALEYAGLPQFLIDCRSRPGQSGSPVIAHRKAGDTIAVERTALGARPLVLRGQITRFLGIYSGRINSESDLGIVWKKQPILELLKAL
jgi:hypothetical protein